MKLYLDTNVFYNAYSPVEESEICDWLLDQLEPDFMGITSEWSIIEMFRAFKKQVNLGVINNNDASIATTYFLTELGDMERNNNLKLLSINKKSIIGGRKYIFEKNLYSADALHLFQAIEAGVDCFITFDIKLQSRISELKIVDPWLDNFKDKILRLKKNKSLT